MYMLMDAADPTIQELLGFSPIRPLRTVHALLEEKGGLALLSDPLLPTATAEIVAAGRSRADVQRAIKTKEAARATLARRYASAQLSSEDILRCCYSLADNAAFLAHARDPVDRALAMLEARFPEDAPAGGGGGGGGLGGGFASGFLSRAAAPPDPRSLAITSGVAGARLTHSHARQRAYVRQSLALWRAIAHDSFRLWCLADADLLDAANPHRLSNTGQGLQRVQQAPRVGGAMRALLAAVQARLGSWVGSSVVHLGDHNVPNALFFLIKYNAVPAILVRGGGEKRGGRWMFVFFDQDRTFQPSFPPPSEPRRPHRGSRAPPRRRRPRVCGLPGVRVWVGRRRGASHPARLFRARV